MIHARRVAGLALLALLLAPWSLSALEARLFLHLLVQMPLLVIAGALLAPVTPRRGAKRDVAEAREQRALAHAAGSGGPGVALAVFVALFWMLPRSMDAALSSGEIEAAKLATLPLAVGLPLAHSWPRLGSVARGFLLGNLPPMLAVLSWLYTSAPTRVCSYYLSSDQARTGQAFAALAICVAVYLVVRAFRPAHSFSDEGSAPGSAGSDYAYGS